jgi:hypothetical protein
LLGKEVKTLAVVWFSLTGALLPPVVDGSSMMPLPTSLLLIYMIAIVDYSTTCCAALVAKVEMLEG